MKRFTLHEIDSLNVLTFVNWCGRVVFMFGFGVVFALALIFARWSQVTKDVDVNSQYTAIRLQAENEQLRTAIGEMQKQLKPVKKTTQNIGGE